MPHRTWFKIFAKEWLQGSLREETSELRGIWADVLALTATGDYADSGQIMVAKNVGYTDLQLKKVLQISHQRWLAAKKRLIKTERISVDGDNIITILNWKRYQSEYLRQKPYRVTDDSNPKLQEIPVTKGDDTEGDRDRDRDTTTIRNTSFQAWEDCTRQLITEHEGREIGCLIDDYGDDQVNDAIREAADNGRHKVSIRYISTILKRWQAEGRGPRKAEAEEREWNPITGG